MCNRRSLRCRGYAREAIPCSANQSFTTAPVKVTDVKWGLHNVGQHLAVQACIGANVINRLRVIQMLNHPLQGIVGSNLKFLLQKILGGIFRLVCAITHTLAFEPRIHVCTRQTASRKMGLNNFSQHIAANAIACANIVNRLGFIQMLNHPLLRIVQRNLKFLLEKNLQWDFSGFFSSITHTLAFEPMHPLVPSNGFQESGAEQFQPAYRC